MNFHKLETADFSQKYETIYQNLFPLKSTVYKYISYFCIKRILIGMGTVLIVSPIVFNIYLYMFLSLFTIAYNIIHRPMNTKVV